MSLQTSTLEGVTSFLLLRNVQNACKSARDSLKKLTGNLNILSKMAKSEQNVKEYFIFSFFLCVRIEIYSCLLAVICCLI